MAFPAQSIDFERGSQEAATITDAAQTGLAFSDVLSFEAWVKLEDVATAGTQQQFFVKRNPTGNQRSYTWYWDKDTGAFQFAKSADGAAVQSVSVLWTPTTAVWYHIAVTKSGTSVKFYVNGAQQGTTQTISSSGIFDSTATVEVGAFSADTQWMDGRMVLLRAWSTERTQAELDANKCLILGATTGLQGEWTFDNVYTDNSGNGNTLTGVNTPTFGANIPSTCSGEITVELLTLLGVG